MYGTCSVIFLTFRWLAFKFFCSIWDLQHLYSIYWDSIFAPSLLNRSRFSQWIKIMTITSHPPVLREVLSLVLLWLHRSGIYITGKVLSINCPWNWNPVIGFIIRRQVLERGFYCLASAVSSRFLNCPGFFKDQLVPYQIKGNQTVKGHAWPALNSISMKSWHYSAETCPE